MQGAAFACNKPHAVMAACKHQKPHAIRSACTLGGLCLLVPHQKPHDALVGEFHGGLAEGGTRDRYSDNKQHGNCNGWRWRFSWGWE